MQIEQYKKDTNVEFDVIYSDGTRRRVKEGILFEETEEHELHMHNGTNNFWNVIEAIFVSMYQMVHEES